MSGVEAFSGIFGPSGFHCSNEIDRFLTQKPLQNNKQFKCDFFPSDQACSFVEMKVWKFDI